MNRSFPLKQLETLRGRKTIRTIRMEGKVFDGKFLKFFYVCRHGLVGPFRLGVIVSKGRGTAVHRNLIKRRIRQACNAILRDNSSALESVPVEVSTVIAYRESYRRPTERLSFASVKNDVAEFIAELRLPSVSR